MDGVSLKFPINYEPTTRNQNRHPVDFQPKVLPFQPIIEKIRSRVVELTGFQFNHCLIQLCNFFFYIFIDYYIGRL
jgi:hypothetical protein